MAVGTRIRQDFIEGTLVSNLSTSATAMESDGLADLTVIDNATNDEYAAAVIGDEVVHIITHNSTATTAEIQRGQEGTTAAAHDAGAAWHHGPTEDDFTALDSTPGVRVYRTTNQSIANAAGTMLSFEAEESDVGGYFDSGTPDRVTVPTGYGGVHLVMGQVRFAGTAGPSGSFAIYKNGGTGPAFHGNPNLQTFNTIARVTLVDGDYLQFRVYQDTGGALDAVGRADFTYAAIIRLGD